MTQHPFDEELDTTGLRCPEPVMMLHKVIRKVQDGICIKVIATDPSTKRDIPKFCTFLGHELIAQEANDTTYVYWIVKKAKKL